MITKDQGNASIELACGLAEEVVRTFGEVRLRVCGTSMVPSILPGDFVTIRRAGLNEISAGEIVLFLQNGRLVVHRAVGWADGTTGSGAEPHLITRGDRIRHDDPPVNSQELLGRVVCVERNSMRVDLLPRRSNRLIARILRASDRITYLYLRFTELGQALLLRRAKCRA